MPNGGGAGRRGRGGPAWSLWRSTATAVMLLALDGAAQAQTIRVGSFTKSTGGAPRRPGGAPRPRARPEGAHPLDRPFRHAPYGFLHAFGMTDGTTSRSVAMASQDDVGRLELQPADRGQGPLDRAVGRGPRRGGGPHVLGWQQLHPHLDHQRRHRRHHPLHRDRRGDRFRQGRGLDDGRRGRQQVRDGRRLQPGRRPSRPRRLHPLGGAPPRTRPLRRSVSGPWTARATSGRSRARHSTTRRCRTPSGDR